MRSSLAKMLLATVASGLLSGVTLIFEPIGVYMVFFGPGVFFGLATGYVLAATKRISSRRILPWVITTTAAWYVALQCLLFFATKSLVPSVSIPEHAYGTVIAGVVGSTILALMLSLLVRRLKAVNIFLTIAVGAIAALFIIAIPRGEVPGPEISLSFVLWQVGVGLSLLGY